MDRQTISWIFLSIVLASQKEPADYGSISSIADAINHAVPTDKEMQSSLSWLTRNGLIIKIGRKYSLTEKGKIKYEVSSKSASTVLKIWENIETQMKKYEI